MQKILLLIVSIFLLSSCSETVERLKRVGKSPKLAQLEIPNAQPDEPDEIAKSINDRNRKHMKQTNSLWQPGSTTFFRDNRTWQLGDIVQVTVFIKDSATLNNSTKHGRKSKDNMALAKLFGKENIVASALSAGTPAGTLIDTSNEVNNAGSGNIARTESINTIVAAVVTKILPNGNLVIQGHQEIRVNNELREVKVAGIIRPKDISSNNSVMSNQIAEARISYGGRGIISDMQQPRVGTQVIDAISPF